jgi:chromosome segregation ATPase
VERQAFLTEQQLFDSEAERRKLMDEAEDLQQQIDELTARLAKASDEYRALETRLDETMARAHHESKASEDLTLRYERALLDIQKLKDALAESEESLGKQIKKVEEAQEKETRLNVRLDELTRLNEELMTDHKYQLAQHQATISDLKRQLSDKEGS